MYAEAWELNQHGYRDKTITILLLLKENVPKNLLFLNLHINKKSLTLRRNYLQATPSAQSQAVAPSRHKFNALEIK